MPARILTLLAALALPCAPALAKKPPKPDAPTAAKLMTFEDDQVEGDRTLPQMELIGVHTSGTHESLIRIRTTFVPEMLKSANEI